ncbi:response regulator [Paenibacillus sp. sgz500958]|uniref:response regulator n=1 Tax=Paenibacillus sp. sgz500958 TaxID=3242475 RepID=UPI0036D2C4E2
MIKVLLVGDETPGREIVKTYGSWETMGLEIAGIAENAQDVLRLIKRSSVQIVITDVHTPGVGGKLLLNNLHEFFPKVKVIVLSRFHDFRYAQSAMRAGASDYLLKPVDPRELHAVLQRCRQELEAFTRQQSSALNQDISLTLLPYKQLLRVQFNLLNKAGVTGSLQEMKQELELYRSSKPGNIRQVAQEMVMLLRELMKESGLEDRSSNLPIHHETLASIESLTTYLIQLYSDSLKLLMQNRCSCSIC